MTLEDDSHHARVARSNLRQAAVPQRVDVHLGPALDTLPTLVGSSATPFDVCFVDVDKPNNPHYLDWVLRLSRPGTLIVADNIVQDGRIVDPDTEDDRGIGVRSFLDSLATKPKLDATGIQTVGSKGWDGFALAMVSG